MRLFVYLFVSHWIFFVAFILWIRLTFECKTIHMPWNNIWQKLCVCARTRERECFDAAGHTITFWLARKQTPVFQHQQKALHYFLFFLNKNSICCWADFIQQHCNRWMCSKNRLIKSKNSPEKKKNYTTAKNMGVSQCKKKTAKKERKIKMCASTKTCMIYG